MIHKSVYEILRENNILIPENDYKRLKKINKEICSLYDEGYLDEIDKEKIIDRLNKDIMKNSVKISDLLRDLNIEIGDTWQGVDGFWYIFKNDGLYKRKWQGNNFGYESMCVSNVINNISSIKNEKK